jgi:hypothetical protein
MTARSDDRLLRLADEIDTNASISSRPGQMGDLERIAADIRTEHARLIREIDKSR